MAGTAEEEREIKEVLTPAEAAINTHLPAGPRSAQESRRGIPSTHDLDGMRIDPEGLFYSPAFSIRRASVTVTSGSIATLERLPRRAPTGESSGL